LHRLLLSPTGTTPDSTDQTAQAETLVTVPTSNKLLPMDTVIVPQLERKIKTEVLQKAKILENAGELGRAALVTAEGSRFGRGSPVESDWRGFRDLVVKFGRIITDLGRRVWSFSGRFRESAGQLDLECHGRGNPNLSTAAGT
jgi:hypothetical protein